MKTDYQYITFRERVVKTKTRKWQCLNRRSGNELGEVKWYSPWRRFAYMPTVQGVYTGECLQAIMEFLVEADADHKGAG